MRACKTRSSLRKDTCRRRDGERDPCRHAAHEGRRVQRLHRQANQLQHVFWPTRTNPVRSRLVGGRMMANSTPHFVALLDSRTPGDVDAARTFFQQRGQESQCLLTEVLSVGSDRQVINAVLLLSEYREASCIPALVDVLHEHNNPIVRETTANALALFKDERAVAALAVTLN